MGVILTEQLRTFGGEARYLDQHLVRLKSGLDILGLPNGVISELPNSVNDLLKVNKATFSEVEEWRIGICVTPGDSLVAAKDQIPTTIVSTKPLDIQKLEAQREQGIRLTVVETREVADSMVPKEIKHRSRIHYWLANQAATKKNPGSYPLLLTLKGTVAESSIASIAILNKQTVTFPVSKDVQESITCQLLRPVFRNLGFEFLEADIPLQDLLQSDEVFWMNATSVIAPVTHVGTNPVGDGKPGSGFKRIYDAWVANQR